MLIGIGVLWGLFTHDEETIGFFIKGGSIVYGIGEIFIIAGYYKQKDLVQNGVVVSATVSDKKCEGEKADGMCK